MTPLDRECGNCRFWCDYQSGASLGTGTCHRHAPVVPLHIPAKAAWETHGVWPLTHESASCGDWEAKSEQQS